MIFYNRISFGATKISSQAFCGQNSKSLFLQKVLILHPLSGWISRLTGRLAPGAALDHPPVGGDGQGKLGRE